jgi:hypothetical protein
MEKVCKNCKHWEPHPNAPKGWQYCGIIECSDFCDKPNEATALAWDSYDGGGALLTAPIFGCNLWVQRWPKLYGDHFYAWCDDCKKEAVCRYWEGRIMCKSCWIKQEGIGQLLEFWPEGLPEIN